MLADIIAVYVTWRKLSKGRLQEILPRASSVSDVFLRDGTSVASGDEIRLASSRIGVRVGVVTAIPGPGPSSTTSRRPRVVAFILIRLDDDKHDGEDNSENDDDGSGSCEEPKYRPFEERFLGVDASACGGCGERFLGVFLGRTGEEGALV